MALFLVTTLPSSPPVNGDGVIDDDTDGEDIDDDQEPVGNGVPTVVPQEFAQSAQDLVSISEKVDLAVLTSPVSQRGFVPGIPVGHGGGGGNGEEDNDHEGDLQVFDAVVRVKPDPVPSPGIDVEAFGITNAPSSTHAIFELFGPECPVGDGGIPCAIVSDFTELSPPSFDPIPEINAICSDGNLCEEYSVVFSGEHFGTKGEYLVKVTFFDSNDNVVAIKDRNFRVHSFFVIPESQIGTITLILSALGTLGFFYMKKRRNKAPQRRLSHSA